jgi:hypothetical protein
VSAPSQSRVWIPRRRLANGITLSGKFDGEFANRSSTYAGTGTLRVNW